MVDENPSQYPDWQRLKNRSIVRKHAGDIVGAIEDMNKAIELAKGNSALASRTSIMLNYLADLCLTAGFVDRAESAIKDALDLSRDSYPILHADNLLIEAAVLNEKGRHQEAMASAQEALSLYREWYGHFPDRVSQVENQVQHLASFQ